MSLNPDPLTVEDELWDPALNEWVPRKSGLPALVTGIIAGLVVGIVLGFTAANAIAAPRSPAESVIPAVKNVPRDVPDALTSGNLAQPATPAPQASIGLVLPHDSTSGGGVSRPLGGAGTHPTSIVRGVASYVGARFGPAYLALPGGPGHRVRICSAIRCVVRTSTDAGPALFEQRAGRVADVSRADFARLCGCVPESIGLLRVRVEYL